MHDFQFLNGVLHCEETSLEKVAREVGTPFYCYGKRTLLRHYKVYADAFKEIPNIICYAVKANSNIGLLHELVKEGAGCDIVSGGELFRALKAGCDPKKIVFAGVGKSAEEIEYALKTGILMFNAESSQELFAIDTIAGRMGKRAGVALRVNPDVDPKTHLYITTGQKKNKFGISMETALEEYRLASRMDNVDVIGVHQHIGSQITQISPFVDAVDRLLAFLEKLRAMNIRIKYIDVGGGLGITYKDEAPPLPKELAMEIVPMLKKQDCTIIFEPGRVIVGNAGVMVTKVLYAKMNEGKTFYVVDAGMNDLVRPALYHAHQEIQPLHQHSLGREKVEADIVGPICESGDFLAKDRVVPEFKQGELMAVMGAGAYGFSMSSNYNSRRRAAEVLVSGDKYHVIRERETWDDLIRGEKMVD